MEQPEGFIPDKPTLPPGFIPDSAEPQSSKGALMMQAAAKAVPAIATAAYDFGTSPTVAKTASSLARNATTLGGVIQGVATASPAQVIAAPREGWAAGKGAYWLTQGAQSAARPVATALETLKPYAQAISTISGAQGVLDLAQMADQTRKDIGFLGFGHGLKPEDLKMSPEEFTKYQTEHPPLINAIVNKIGDLASSLKNNGVPAAEATALKLISAGNAATFGKLMTLYMQSKSVQP